MKYTGSCHCQNIKFEVDLDLKEAMSCNCSICQRRGHLLSFTGMNTLNILSKSKMADYQWGKKNIHFHFCSECGCAPFGHGKGPDGNEMAAINIRCLDNVDVAGIPVTHFDGQKL